MITPEQLQNIASDLASAVLNDELIAQLRQKYAPIHFTYCMDDDIGEFRPALTQEKFNLYFIHSGEHCLSLSQDPDSATGLVVAEIIADA